MKTEGIDCGAETCEKGPIACGTYEDDGGSCGYAGTYAEEVNTGAEYGGYETGICDVTIGVEIGGKTL